jgi:plasmid maintenance system antidote protein VapI
VPSNRIAAILAGHRGVTAGTAILLGERFGTAAEFRLNLQMMHDLETAQAAQASGGLRTQMTSLRASGSSLRTSIICVI